MISNEVRPYLVKVCTALNSHNVDFLVVGGAAVNHYGYIRGSGISNYKAELKVDLDFWYNPTIENYHKILDALDELNVDTSDLKNLVFDKQKTFLKIPHKDFHTDFLPVMNGLDSYRESQAKAESLDLDGVILRILSYDDLIINKRAVNRKADQSDIDELDKIRRKKSRGRRI
jgi:predicted nucleotidyltransferase